MDDSIVAQRIEIGLFGNAIGRADRSKQDRYAVTLAPDMNPQTRILIDQTNAENVVGRPIANSE